MTTTGRLNPRLLMLPILMIVSVSVSVAQAQPQTKAQTRPQTEAKTQPQAKAQTQPQTKAQTQPQTKAETQPLSKAGIQPPTRQTQKAISKTIRKIEKPTTKGQRYSGQCPAINKDGTRCSRRALPGSKYCRQHGGK